MGDWDEDDAQPPYLDSRPRFGVTAGSWISMLFVLGLLLEITGIGLASTEHPSTEAVGFGQTITTGSWDGFWVGVLLAGVGQMGLFVALIAIGVMLGHRASRGL